MKKNIKLIAATATAMVLAGALAPSVASASEVNNTSEMQQVDNNLPTSPIAHTTEVRGNDTIITINDNDMYAYLASQGIFVPNASLLRGVGVTKIVWHGKARYGNVDLYLSKTWLNNMSKASYATIYAAMVAMVPEASVVIAPIASIINGGNFTSGKIFKVRSFGYAGSVNQ